MYSQSITLNSQTDVDNFDSALTHINNSLTIETTDIDDPIFDLSNLSNIISINYDIKIRNNNSMNHLDGLSNISSVGHNLWILDNDAITHLDDLNNIISVEDELFIRQNTSLTDCCAIHTLLTSGYIGGEIKIYDNPSACSDENEIIATCSSTSTDNIESNFLTTRRLASRNLLDFNPKSSRRNNRA